MKSFQVFLCGVGGQGIGMLSEILLQSVFFSGQEARGVDTHGLAQRGGTVVSSLKVGRSYSPLISEGEADLVLALERYEAFRALELYAKPGSTLLFYDTSWQPLGVRLGTNAPLEASQITSLAEQKSVKIVRVLEPQLEDPRMQNTVVLGHVFRLCLIPGVQPTHVLHAMEMLMAPSLFARNRILFERILSANPPAGGAP